MPTNTQPLIRKLESIGELSDQDRGALASLPVQVSNLDADEDVVRERDLPSVCCLLLDGYMHRYKVLPDGKAKSWPSIRRVMCPTCKVCFCGGWTATWQPACSSCGKISI
jgi:hypothetical protein